MLGNSFDPNRSNVIVGVALAIAVLAFSRFVAALMGAATEGEIAGALGSFVGGVIGAGGAVLAVYVALSSQRSEETAKVAAAVKTEVASLTTYIIGAVEICQTIASGIRQVPRQDAGYILRKLFGEPVVYKAVADRIGLLPHPNATVQFYMRLSEAKAMVESLQLANIAQEYVSAENAATIADSLSTALQLARGILAGDGDPRLLEWVRQVMVSQIDECLQSAKVSFPNAESFRTPDGRPSAEKRAVTGWSG
jgi:hypothetical protein